MAFFDLLRAPDRVAAYTEPYVGKRATRFDLSDSRLGWQASGIKLRTVAAADSLAITLTAPTKPVLRLHLRWGFGTMEVSPGALFLGDAWERSYGDLAWRTMVPERALPWYFAANAGGLTHVYGVRTGAAAFCFWQVDPAGVSLWLDLSNGGDGVLLGDRELPVATVIARRGMLGEQPFVAVQSLCKMLCPRPRLSAKPVYGTNDWYYAYGNNNAAGILRDTDLVATLAPARGTRPFSVIDGGWEGNAGFPDMAQLAREIRSRDVRPGIWIRPVEAPKSTAANLLLPAKRFRAPAAHDSEAAFDPTIPEARAAILAKVRQAVDWGYELIKHDYSTYDLLGQWGFEMGVQPTLPGWHFADQSRTNAEIILDLYKGIRSAAGEKTLLLGCNTVGHLSAGLFELQRTGDDTSGREWDRTRRMGVNTLAYRLPQHRTFFDLDADCVGLTKAIPWSLNRQWLSLVARSGTSLFLSPAPDAMGPEQKAAIREAFAIAAGGQSTGRARDWMAETTPEEWDFPDGAKRFRWSAEDGADPFSM